MDISVIILAYNEADVIAETVATVFDHGGEHISEVFVVDGGSTDDTTSRAEAAGADVVYASQKGRAAQMNFGAQESKGDVLYFLHADSHPPDGFVDRITEALSDGGCDAGCFQLAFDDDHWLLTCYAWFTRFDINAFRFGDQSLFITRTAFFEVGGFREDYKVMEDQEIVRRIRQSYNFTILDDKVTTSARKYREIGVVKLQLVFALIFTLYYLGVSQKQLVKLYKRLIP